MTTINQDVASMRPLPLAGGSIRCMVVSHAGPDLPESIDQPKPLTAWRLRYTMAHVRSLQSLAPLIYYSFHPRFCDEHKYDPIVLFDGSAAAEKPGLCGSRSMLPPDDHHCVEPCELATPSISFSVPCNFLLSNGSTNPVYY